jgi:hypothetical protein
MGCPIGFSYARHPVPDTWRETSRKNLGTLACEFRVRSSGPTREVISGILLDEQ